MLRLASLCAVVLCGCPASTPAPELDAAGLPDGGASDGGARVDAPGCALPDRDGDGFDGLACGGTDCDDDDPTRSPARTEVCDDEDVDEDCNPDTFGFRDRDGDLAADVACCNLAAGGPVCGTDCDDVRRSVNPDSPEVCNLVDDDCDTGVDEGVTHLYFRDADVDGHGRAGDSSALCAPTGEYTATNDDDCDDADPLVHPGAAERCNLLDDDCSSGGAAEPAEDVDADGHAAAGFVGCEGGFPRDDCDDGDVRVHPGAGYQREPRCLGPGAPCTESGTWTCGVRSPGSIECAALIPKGVVLSWDYDCAGPDTGTPEPPDGAFCPPVCAFGVTCRGPTELRPVTPARRRPAAPRCPTGHATATAPPAPRSPRRGPCSWPAADPAPIVAFLRAGHVPVFSSGMGRRSLSVLSVVTALVVLGAASLGTGQDGSAGAGGGGRRGRRSRGTTSVGLPFSGSLRNGVLLAESSTVRYAGEYAPGGNFYGTSELVQLIERAAARVERRVPGARLSVGELSDSNGGRLDGHRSHQNGRDADISFYMLDAAGDPYDPYGFAGFDRHGHGLPPNESLTFDDRRNWELVARLVADPDARVQYIFVADTLRNRLLREGRRVGASDRVMTRAEAVMMQPSHGHPHRNHFHVRIYCPPADRPGCEDREPFHAWYPGTPPVGSGTASADATAEP